MTRVMVAALAVLSACASTSVERPHTRSAMTGLQAIGRASSAHFDAPAADAQARPWAVGQFAAYQLGHGDVRGLENLRVIALDTCGYWFEDQIREAGTDRTWQFCVQATPPAWPGDSISLWAVVERRDGKVVAYSDFRNGAEGRAGYQWLVERVHAAWRGWSGVPQEDLTTPAGHFAGAFKVTANRWSHPSAPFSGLVKEVSGDGERELVAFGTTSFESRLVDGALDTLELQRDLQRQEQRARSWFGLGYGLGRFGTARDTAPTLVLDFATGYRIGAKLDATLAFDLTGETPYARDPLLYEDLVVALAGIRWSPFGRVAPSSPAFAVDQRSLYVDAQLGYAQLERGPLDAASPTAGRGVAVSAGIGLLCFGARDWSFGVELRDHMAFLNSDEGERHAFALYSFINLFPRRHSHVRASW